MERQTQGPQPRRSPWLKPVVTSAPYGSLQPVLLACTGRFDCEPVVGFPCCKNNVNACNGCKP